jgi:hypothetical protein
MKREITLYTPKQQHQFSSINCKSYLCTPKNAQPLNLNASKKPPTAHQNPTTPMRQRTQNEQPVVQSSIPQTRQQLISKLSQIITCYSKMRRKAIIPGFEVVNSRNNVLPKAKSTAYLNDNKIKPALQPKRVYEDNVNILKQSQSYKLQLMEKENAVIELRQLLDAKTHAFNELTEKYNQSQSQFETLKQYELSLSQSLQKYKEEAKVREHLIQEINSKLKSYEENGIEQLHYLNQIEKEKEDTRRRLKETEINANTAMSNYIDNLAKAALSKDSLVSTILALKAMTKGKSQDVLQEKLLLFQAERDKNEAENKIFTEKNKILARLCNDSYHVLREIGEEEAGSNAKILLDQMKINYNLFTDNGHGTPCPNPIMGRYWVEHKQVETDLTTTELSEKFQRLEELEKIQRSFNSSSFSRSDKSTLNSK